MGNEIVCSKGSNENDYVTVTEKDFKTNGIDLDKCTLAELRKILEQKSVNGSPFIRQETDECQYLFMMPLEDTGKTYEKYEDYPHFIHPEYERILHISDIFFYNRRHIILFNSKKKKKPDLMGYATNFWTGGKLRVGCRLKQTKDDSNKGKFQPLMLTNVVSTSKNAMLNYNNVCICCEDSVVEFPLRCYGTLGFEFRARLEAGETICDSAVHWAKGDENIYGNSCLDFWEKEDGDKNIKIKAIENVSGIDPATKMQYQKIIFEARDMLSWYDDGKEVTPKKHGVRLLRTAPQQEIIRGEDIKPSTTVPEGNAEVDYGKWYIGNCKPWEELEGSVTVFFFVFSSLEKAKQYIDAYNILPPEQQEAIWN